MQNLRSLIIIFLALSSLKLFPQAITLVHPVYVEHYTTPKVAGTLLVGLRLHSATGPFDPRAVSIHVNHGLRGRHVCVSIASQDGMYYAENLYNVSPDAPEVSTFQTITKYAEQLKNYSADQVAVNVRATEDCNGANGGDLVPAQFTGGPDDLVLVADINSDPDRLAVELTNHSGASWKAVCTTGAGSRVAFTSTCEFRPHTLDAGPYDLLVHLRERTRVRDIHFPVRIP